MIPQVGLQRAVDEQALVSGADGNVEILHVEDDPAFADLVASFLERENESFAVTTETDPREALDRLERTGFDCVVCDYEMPGLNGLEVLERVRGADWDVPFILFTGRGSEEIASEAISAGVTEYLQKGGGTEQYSVLANRIENAVAKHRAEEQVRRGFHAIETAHDGISLLNANGEFVYVNRAYADVTGYDREEMIGQHWERLYREQDVDEVYEEILPQARAGEWTGRTVFERKDGETVTVDHTLAYTDDDTLICTISEVGDVAEVKRELSVRERAMDEAPVGIVLTDPNQPDDPVVYANDEFSELTGYPREEILGRNCRFLQGEETREEPVETMRSAVDAAEPVTVELRNYRKDGELFWNRVTITPLTDDGEVTHFVGFQEDVTAQRELLAGFETLGRELAHDMANPLQTLRGRLELALETGDVAHVEAAMPALDRMEHLIDDVADVLESGAVVSERAELDVGALAEGEWKSLDTHGADLEVDGAPRIVGDGDAVRRLLDNLLGNAVEHGGGDVRVRVGELPDGFYVEDDGPGVPEDLRERVFEQGVSTKDGDGSLGLGLSSVRQIVLSHGWRIRVADGGELGGARFEVRTGAGTRAGAGDV